MKTATEHLTELTDLILAKNGGEQYSTQHVNSILAAARGVRDRMAHAERGEVTVRSKPWFDLFDHIVTKSDPESTLYKLAEAVEKTQREATAPIDSGYEVISRSFLKELIAAYHASDLEEGHLRVLLRNLAASPKYS